MYVDQYSWTADFTNSTSAESELEEDVMNREDKDRKEELAEEHKRAVVSK